MVVPRDAYAQQTLGENLMDKLNKVRIRWVRWSTVPAYTYQELHELALGGRTGNFA